MSAHDDYDRLMAALKACDSGRWDYDEIDCCWTGKYADLDPWGYQGLHVDEVTNERIYFTSHIGKTFCGEPEWDIEDITYEDYEALLECYLEQAGEIVSMCGVPGDWSGDDWFLSTTVAGEVEWVLDEETGEFDYEATADAMVAEGERILKDVEDELRFADETIDRIYADVEKNYREILCHN